MIPEHGILQSLNTLSYYLVFYPFNYVFLSKYWSISVDKVFIGAWKYYYLLISYTLKIYDMYKKIFIIHKLNGYSIV